MNRCISTESAGINVSMRWAGAFIVISRQMTLTGHDAKRIWRIASLNATKCVNQFKTCQVSYSNIIYNTLCHIFRYVNVLLHNANRLVIPPLEAET